MQQYFSSRTMLVCEVAALILMLGPLGLAQVDTGAVLGTVRDQSGAVVPGARVTLTNEGTAFATSTTAREDGTYIFTPVRIGTYTLTAEFQGFQRVTRVHVTVDVQQQVSVDFTLVPGAVTQTVEVSAAPPLLQAQNASVGQVVASKDINELPLNGRNYVFLAQLSAGVTFGQEDVRGENAHGRFTANGTRPTQNNYILDGLDNNTQIISIQNGKDFGVLPPIDAIAEFKVQTNNYSAEFGRGAGAVMNATMKSGVNRLHGSAWEFLRNDKLDAADFFLNAANKPIGKFRQNQFGFTLGGPIVLPSVYNGKNKTFFFSDYEGLRIRQGNPFVSTVPTLAERNSGFTNFSDLIRTGSRTDLLGRTFPVGIIFDPATTRSVTQGQADPVTGLMPTANGFVRDPFPGNLILAPRLDPNAIKLLELLPTPNGPGLFSNYTSDPVFQQNVNTFDTRVDHNFSERDQMFVRYSLYNIGRIRPGPFPGLADGSNSLNDSSLVDHSQSVVLSEAHSFSPSLLNEFRVGYSREHVVFLQPFGNQTGIPEQFGIQGVVQRPENGGLPAFYAGNVTRFGSGPYLPSDKFSNTFQLEDNVTRIYRSHTFKAGAFYQHINYPWAQPPYSRGEFHFVGGYTSVVNQVDRSTGIAQFLLTPTPATVPNGIDNVGGANLIYYSGFHAHNLSRNYFGTYFQDDWRATRKLTLNLGLRWEFFTPVQENFGDQANFIPGAPFNGAEYLIPNSRKSSVPSTFISALANDGIDFRSTGNFALALAQHGNFAPRFGFAYELTPKWVVRGGYGIFYGGLENIGGGPLLVENFPFEFVVSRFSPNNVLPMTADNSIGLIENSLLNISLDPKTVDVRGVTLQGAQYHWLTPYTQGYNLMTQYQLTPSSSATIGYVGSAGRHIPNLPGANEVSEILPPDENPQDFVPFPDFAQYASYTTTEGASGYNSLQTTFERRFSHGFDFLANYTWSKVRTDAGDPLEGTFPGNRAPYIRGFGVKADYHLADFDVRQILHFSGSYELPLGPGKRFAGGSSGVIGQLTGGWSLNWILTLQDGQPLTLSCINTTAAGVGCYALLVPGRNPIGGKHNVDQWLNPAAFVDPPFAAKIGQTDLAPLGGAATQVVGPGFHRLDFSLFKQFKISETTRLEFRAEFFNLTNTPNFSVLSILTDYTDPTSFGKISATRDNPNDPRQIQFALKFYW
jgi:hypothetical protein